MEEECVESLSRQEQAARIIEQANLYKVCEVCGSVVPRKEAFCLNCKGYRFNSDPDEVCQQAAVLAVRQPRSITLDDLSS